MDFDYRDSHRRLHDGITIDVQDAKILTPDGDRWIHVRVSSLNGAALYSGQMPLVAAQSGPIGVYQGADAEEACKAAAADVQGMGTFFAIEGTPWGLELMAPDAGRFGSHASPMDRLSRSLDRLEDIDRRIAQLQRGQED